MSKYLLILLTGCGPSPHDDENYWVRIPKHEVCAQSEVPKVPYPDAQSLVGQGAIAPSPDSDCSGALRTTSPLREGAWSMGKFKYNRWDPILVFNTERDARICLASSRELEVRVLRDGKWAQ